MWLLLFIVMVISGVKTVQNKTIIIIKKNVISMMWFIQISGGILMDFHSANKTLTNNCTYALDANGNWMALETVIEWLNATTVCS